MTFWRPILNGLFKRKIRTIQSLRSEIGDLTGGQPILWYQECRSTFEEFEIRCLTTRYVIRTEARKRRADTLPLMTIDAVSDAEGTAINFLDKGRSKVIARWEDVKGTSIFFNRLGRIPEYKGLEGMI